MNKGFGLIEVVVAVAVILIALFAWASAMHSFFMLVDESARIGRAAFLLEEGIEAVRTLRDVNWSSLIEPLTTDTPYYPWFDGHWRLYATDPGLIDGVFSRMVLFDSVYRRTSDSDIVDPSSPDPKAIDPETRKITVMVSWTTPSGPKTRSMSTYITNLFQE